MTAEGKKKTGKETSLVILNFFLHPICNTSAELINNGDDCFSISTSTGVYRRIHLDLDSYLDKKGNRQGDIPVKRKSATGCFEHTEVND